MNPIKEIRTQLNLTQSELADLAGITQQGVLRYEQSLYENPSAKLVSTLAQLLHSVEYPESHGSDPPLRATENSIIEAYRANRTEIQRSAGAYFRNPYPVINRGYVHPFVTWRSVCLGDASRMRFCILLAVHPSTVAEYEKGKRRHMPRLLREALITAGVGNTTLEELDYAGTLWYDEVVRA